MTSSTEDFLKLSLAVLDDEKTVKERHLKRLLELSLISLGEVPQLSKPSYEQMQWFNRKMKAPEWAWRSFA